MVNTSFWQHPPWQGGPAKHRLGLKPVEAQAWLQTTPGSEVLRNKRKQLSEHYETVVGVMPGAHEAQALLRNLPVPTAVSNRYPDAIANVALVLAEDLCLLDIDDQQRLIAGCVCAPSYWHLREKLGQPLTAVHAPVDGMNAKIGNSITRFMQRMPVTQPFTRSNWFLHGDATLYHPDPELSLPASVDAWTVRGERQTLCKLSPQYLLFTIEVICEPLADIAGFETARSDLERSLSAMDADEIAHFGGVAKHRRLHEYVAGDRTSRKKQNE